jgi:hypothetical protein
LVDTRWWNSAMNRREMVRRLVLDTICDDYENVDQVILREVAEWGTRCGLTIGRSEVVDALAGLIADGLAKAYELSALKPFSKELPGMPPLDGVEEDFRTYFLATEKGMDLQLSDGAWWPFDDEDNLRADWHLDSA